MDPSRHFAEVAADYAAHRPGYPETLFEYLAVLAPRRDTAWDCAAGSGQAARALAGRFRRVVATDMGVAPLRAAGPRPPFHRVACRAEASCLADASVDLVTVAQALHWLDARAFWGEVQRVGRADGVVAAWCYSLCRVTPEVDRVMDVFHGDTLGPWWAPARRHVEAGYRTLPFPFDELPAPGFAIRRRMTGREMLAYVGTWSAVAAFREGTGSDPMPPFADRLAAAWGDLDAPLEVTWPLHLRLGRIPAPDPAITPT